MNEQQMADGLGALIDNRASEQSRQLPTDESAFALRLLSLRDQTHADQGFADALEAQFKTAPRSSFRNRPQIVNRGSRGRLVYTMATFAAALVIVAAAVLTVPPLRTLTQNVYSQLFENAVATQPIVSATTTLPEVPTAGYMLASAPLSSGFHVLGRALHYNDFAINLVESAFTSYIHLMSSVSSKSVSS